MLVEVAVAVAVGVAKIYPAATTAPKKSAETTNKIIPPSMTESVARLAGLEASQEDSRAGLRKSVTELGEPVTVIAGRLTNPEILLASSMTD